MKTKMIMVLIGVCVQSMAFAGYTVESSFELRTECTIPLFTTGKPCRDYPLRPGPTHPGPGSCTAYPAGAAQVSLAVNNGDGEAEVFYKGHSYHLTCKLFNPANGSFVCSGNEIRLSGSPAGFFNFTTTRYYRNDPRGSIRCPLL